MLTFQLIIGYILYSLPQNGNLRKSHQRGTQHFATKMIIDQMSSNEQFVEN